MSGQRNDAERDALYTKFAENKKLPLPEKQRLAYYAAKDYLKEFDQAGDEYAPEMRKFVREYEKVMKTTLEADLERTPQRFKNWCLSKTVVISRGVSSEGKISLSLFENETYIVASETNTWEERSSEGC